MAGGWGVAVLGRGHQPRRAARTTEPTWGQLEGTGGRDQATSHLGLSVQVGCAEAVPELWVLLFHKELREGMHTFPDQGLRRLLRPCSHHCPQDWCQASGQRAPFSLRHWRKQLGPLGETLFLGKHHSTDLLALAVFANIIE